MFSLEQSDGLNAEGYCRQCNYPLGIDGRCIGCEAEKLNEIRTEDHSILYGEFKLTIWKIGTQFTWTAIKPNVSVKSEDLYSSGAIAFNRATDYIDRFNKRSRKRHKNK